MYAEKQSHYSPACRPANPGACSQCTLAFDCRAKAENSQKLPWALITLAMLAVLAFIAN